MYKELKKAILDWLLDNENEWRGCNRNRRCIAHERLDNLRHRKPD